MRSLGTALQFLLIILLVCFPRQIFTLNGRIVSIRKPIYSSRFTAHDTIMSARTRLLGVKFSSFTLNGSSVISWIANLQISKQLSSALVKLVGTLPSSFPVLGLGLIFGTLFITLLSKILTRKPQQSSAAVQAFSEALGPEVVTVKIDIQQPLEAVSPAKVRPISPSPPAVTFPSVSTPTIVEPTSTIPSFNPIKKWGNKGKGSRWSPGSLIKPKP